MNNLCNKKNINNQGTFQCNYDHNNNPPSILKPYLFSFFVKSLRLFAAIFLVFSLSVCGGGGSDDGGGDSGGADTADTAVPVITLSGANPMTVDTDSIFTDPGATASDNVDGDITASIVVGGDVVNTAFIGTYTVTYDVTDAAGNPATQVTRTVNTLPAVKAFYSTSGANWNDYVVSDGTNRYDATDTVCNAVTDGPGYSACIHGGEMRSVQIPSLSVCGDLAATDALGAFDWTCDASTSPVRMVTTGLKDSKNLSDLLDFTTPGWLSNSVTVTGTGTGLPFTTASAAWWANAVTLDNDGGSLATSGVVYVVTANPYVVYTVDASKVALVIQPGVIINGTMGTGSNQRGEDTIYAGTKNFLWIEGTIDATEDNSGVFWSFVKFSVIRNVGVANAANYGDRMSGIYISNSSNNILSNITTVDNIYYGVNLKNSSYNILSNITATAAPLINYSYGVYLDGSSYNTLSNVTASGHSERDGVTLTGSSNNNALSNITVSGNKYGVNLRDSLYNTISNITADNNGSSGIYFYGSSYNILSNINATNSITGIFLWSSSNNNSLSNITATNNGAYGIHLKGSLYNTLSIITASNNGSSGVRLDGSSYNILSNITAANNGSGFFLWSSSNNNSLTNITVANNVYNGVRLEGSSYNIFSNVTAANNSYGFRLYNASNNTMSNITAANNDYGVYLDGSSGNNYFTGLLKVGNNTTGDCYVNNESSSGALIDDNSGGVYNIHDGVCLTASPSDFTLITGVTLASSFVAKVTTDDSVNTSDSSGTATYSTSLDWTSFENIYRSWGINGAAFPNASNRDQWTGGTGRIWDWSVANGDTGDAGNPVIQSVFTVPGGDDTTTHTWSDASTVTSLRGASEIMGDGIGNDNGLCETNETCLYTPNIGSYQGHGALQSAGAFTDGAITGVTLMEYPTNGY